MAVIGLIGLVLFCAVVTDKVVTVIDQVLHREEPDPWKED